MRRTIFPGLVAVLALTGPTQAFAQAGAETKYYYCYASEQAGGKLWVTPIRPAGPDMDALQNAWNRYVKANYLPDVGRNGAQCGVGSAADMKALQKTRATQLHPSQVIDVDWSFWKNGETPAAAAALNQAAAAGQYALCYSDMGQSPVYLSADIHLDVPAGPDPKSTASDGGASARAIDQLKAEFLTYIKASHGYQPNGAYPVECNGNKKSIADLADVRERMHQRFPQLKYVETGWTPGKTPVTAAASPPAQPVPPAAPSAYEKAMEAQRPASAKPAPAPAAEASGQTYSYCFDTSNIPHKPSEPGRSNFYLSGMFPADPAMHPAAAFEKMLRAAHPEERIGTATCIQPQPMATAKTTRDGEIAARKNNPYITVAQVDWTP